MRARPNAGAGLSARHHRVGLLFVAPWIFGFLTLQALPLFQSLAISLSDVAIRPGGYELVPVGLEHFRTMLTIDPEYRPAVIETLVDVLLTVPLVLVFSLFAATLVQPQFPGRAIARSIFFLPVILSSGVVLRIQADDWLYELLQSALESAISDREGEGYLIADVFRTSGASEVVVDYLTDAVERIKEIITLSGVQILVFLAGLQSIPRSFYEASRIEGATSWEIFWKITMPILAPLVFVNAVYTVIDSFTRYDNRIMELVRAVAFGRSNYGLSAAMAWGYFLFVALFLVVIYLLVARRVERMR